MLVRRLARPLLAASFVTGGVDALRHPAPRVARAEAAGLSNAPELVRGNAAAMVVAGLALATGRLPRLSATVLAATLVPTTVIGHPFWAEKDKAARTQQQLHFLKNCGLLGGLLLAAVDLEGREALPRRAAKRAARSAEHAAHRAHLAALGAERRAERGLARVGAALPG